MQLTLIFLIILLGSIIQGATGFGYAIVTMPLLSLIISIKTATILVLLSATLLVFSIFYKMRKHVTYKMITYVVIGGFIGRTAGIFGLENLKIRVLEIILGVLLIIVSIYFFYSNEIEIKTSKSNGLIAGLISGVFGGLFNIAGPPLVVYFFSTIKDKKEYQGTIQATFFLTGLFSVFLHILYGNITFHILKLSSVGIVAVFLGTFIGLKIFNYLNKGHLKRILSILMIIMGVVLVFKG